MNPIDDVTLSRGLTYAEYREHKVRANGEVFDEVYAHPAYTERDLDFLRRLPPLHVVAVAEDWCPDVFHTLPTWARLAEELPGWSFQVFRRDEHPELMDAFLWRKNARRVPVYAFYDESHHLQCWWSGRGREAQEALDEVLAGRSYDELPQEEKEAAAALFRERYPARFRRANFEEVLALLAAFFHLEPVRG